MKQLWLALLLLLALLPIAPASAAPRCFPEAAPTIGDCVDGRIGGFWAEHGGLPVFGYPISGQFSQQVEGRAVEIQLFERNRLELHPANAPPYDVLLGRLGAEMLERQGRDWRTFAKADPSAPHYFSATGHAIAPQFWPFWSRHGLELDGRPGITEAESLALFGLPLSKAAPEISATDRQSYLTQWFERARFEYHPENAPPYHVLLGLLSRELAASGQAAPVLLPPGGFIKAAGARLTRLGQEVRIKGVNYYPQWRPWNPMWRDWDAIQTERELRLARDQLGINVVRVMVPYNFTGKPIDAGKVAPLYLGRLRELAQIAGSLDMRLIVTLFDFYKGFAPPGSHDEQQDFAYLRALVGSFADDDRIMAWDLHNEPDHYDRWKDGDAARVLAWLGRMADVVHRLAPDQLVTVGMGNYENLWLPGPDGRRVIDYSDLISVHFYDAGAVEGALEVVRAHTGKPILIEEFGWPTGPRCVRNYDEATQVLLYRTVLEAARTRAAGVVAWTLRDYDAGPTNRYDSFEEHFGLFRPDNSLKPAGELLRAYTAQPLPSAVKSDLPLTSSQPQLPSDPDGPLLIPGTGIYVKGPFRKAWQLFGGRASFGLPLTNAYVRPEDRRVVQCFEGAVLELHTEGTGDPSFADQPDVDKVRRLIVPIDLGLAFGAERGFEGLHPVSPIFQSFYDGIGGAWRLGTPVSGELVEQIDGAARTVQYFQKGRLERDPAGSVRVGHLG
ncbi:MAG TPA: cellulase family glycosylhydrolase, partial [Roseiflexaceae bacterium]|nr:cellulase family glycosylhydrolase [Roseiflexaceae bacterium]